MCAVLVFQRPHSNKRQALPDTALFLQARTDPRLVCTVGVHPTRCLDFLPSEDAAGVLAALEAADDTAEWAPTEAQLEHAKQYFEELQALVLQGSMEGKVVAIGECGLDYDRLQFCPAAVQRYFFEWHFQLARSAGLPMFLHNRNAGGDFLAMVRRAAECFPYAVSHSFTGSAAEAAELVEAGLYLGVNGCSLKTQESCDVVASIPLDRLMLETDCPWCDIRPTHAGHKHVQSTWPTNKEKKWAPDACVKSRSEPCHIVQVAEVVAGVKGLSVAEVAEAAWQNTVAVFGKPVSA